jgi:hypothetical protein
MRDRDRPDAPTGSVSDRPVQRRAGAGLTVGRLGELPRPPLVDAPAERRASPTVGPTASPTTTPLADPFFYCPTLGGDVVQARGDLGPDADRVRAEAAAGVAGPGQALPHGDAIARSFGPAHELSSVRAHVGGAAATAAAAIGATRLRDWRRRGLRGAARSAHRGARGRPRRAAARRRPPGGRRRRRRRSLRAPRRCGRGSRVAGESAADLLSPTGGAATTGAAVQRAPRPGGARDARGARRDQGRAHGSRERLSPVSALPRDARPRDRLRGEHDQRRQRAPPRHHAERRLVAPARGCAAGLRLRDDPRLRGEDRAVRARLRGRRRRGRVRAPRSLHGAAQRRGRAAPRSGRRARAPRAARRLPRPPAGPGASRRRSPARRDVHAVRLRRAGRPRRWAGGAASVGAAGRRVARGGVEGRGGQRLRRAAAWRARARRAVPRRSRPPLRATTSTITRATTPRMPPTRRPVRAGGGGGRGGRRRHRGDVARDGGGGRGAGVGLHLGGLPGRPALREFVALGRAEAARALAGADRRLVREASDQQRLEFAAAVARRVLAVEEVVDRLAPRQPRGLPAPAPPRAGDRGSAAVRKGYPGAHLTAGMAVD